MTKYKWEGKNRSFEKSKSGGVGFILSKEVLYEVVECEREDIIYIGVDMSPGKFEWTFGCVYFRCKRLNEERMSYYLNK